MIPIPHQVAKRAVALTVHLSPHFCRALVCFRAFSWLFDAPAGGNLLSGVPRCHVRPSGVCPRSAGCGVQHRSHSRYRQVQVRLDCLKKEDKTPPFIFFFFPRGQPALLTPASPLQVPLLGPLRDHAAAGAGPAPQRDHRLRGSGGVRVCEGGRRLHNKGGSCPQPPSVLGHGRGRALRGGRWALRGGR